MSSNKHALILGASGNSGSALLHQAREYPTETTFTHIWAQTKEQGRVGQWPQGTGAEDECDGELSMGFLRGDIVGRAFDRCYSLEKARSVYFDEEMGTAMGCIAAFERLRQTRVILAV